MWLMDLGCVGHKFTWKGKRSRGMVLESLDCALFTNSWIAMNLAICVQHICVNFSNHNPIVIKLEGIVTSLNKLFCFEQMRMKEQDCGDTIKATWSIPPPHPLPSIFSPLVHAKIKLYSEKLIEWSRRSFR